MVEIDPGFGPRPTITRGRPDRETLCRAVCKVRGFDPDKRHIGDMGRVMLLWEAPFIGEQVDTFLALAELCGFFEV